MSSSKSKFLSLLAVIIAVGVGSYLLINQGEFLLTNTSSISNDISEFEEPVYLGNSLSWSGILKPRILDVELMKDYHDNSNDPIFEVFIEDSGHIGVVGEREVLSKYEIASPKNYKMKDKDINIVVRLDSEADRESLESLKSVKINYTILGIAKYQVMEIKLINDLQ